MSLVDPDSRWWRSNLVRSMLAQTMAIIGVALAYLGNATMLGQWQSLGIGDLGLGHLGETIVRAVGILGLVGLFVSIPLVVGGTLLHGFLVDGDGPQPVLLRWSLPGYFIASGLGQLTGAILTALSPSAYGGGQVTMYIMAVVFCVGGVVAIIVMERVRARSAATAHASARTKKQGVTARGTVTRAKSYTRNEVAVTRVTVRFTDGDGQTRYHRETLLGNLSVGRPVTVRYSPVDLGRRGAVIIEER
ncbi:hypothetical protein ACXET9_09395 [Brachybacterium sp. DNPG3]